MKSLGFALLCFGLLAAGAVVSGSAVASPPYPGFYPGTPYPNPPYPEVDLMPQPGWSYSGLSTAPRYEYESIASNCHIPPGLYRYELIPGQDFQTDMAIKKSMVKFHVNEGGMAIVTLEIYPDKNALYLQRLLGDEPRRELYVINSYRRISDLNRCSGRSIRIDAERIRLHDQTLNGVLRGEYEGRECLRVNGELVRRRPAFGVFSTSELRIRLDNVCFRPQRG